MLLHANLNTSDLATLVPNQYHVTIPAGVNARCTFLRSVDEVSYLVVKYKRRGTAFFEYINQFVEPKDLLFSPDPLPIRSQKETVILQVHAIMKMGPNWQHFGYSDVLNFERDRVEIRFFNNEPDFPNWNTIFTVHVS
jgi:hypothetical protein